MSIRPSLLTDVLLVAWASVWIGVAILVAGEIRQLAQVSATARTAGVAVQRAGDTLGQLDAVPLLDGSLAPTADALRETGRRAVESARTTRESAERLALLLGISIAVIPTVPPLVIYLLVRVAGRLPGATGPTVRG